MDTLQRIAMSWEEYLATPEHPRYEWVDGVVEVSPDPTWHHSRIARRLANIFDEELAPLLGATGGNVKLPDNRVRIPDAMVTRGPEGLFIENPPVLVVEVLSPSSRNRDTVVRPAEYAAAGIEQLWLIDPKRRSLEVFANNGHGWDRQDRLDEEQPVGTIRVGEHGQVAIDLVDLLDG